MNILATKQMDRKSKPLFKMIKKYMYLKDILNVTVVYETN